MNSINLLIVRLFICLMAISGSFLHADVADDIASFQPETELESQITSSDEWIEGAAFGEPRSGHPEGNVIYHIFEVLSNVDKYYGDSPLREKLRVITIIHDTFKHKVDPTIPKGGENQHGMIARRFAEQFTNDDAILEVIQRHDDAYFASRHGFQKGDWEKANQEAEKLIQVLGPHLELFLAFYQCDNATGDKTQDHYLWFREIALLSLQQQ